MDFTYNLLSFFKSKIREINQGGAGEERVEEKL